MNVLEHLSPEAVEAQLATIRVIIPPTIKMYKDTGNDIHAIQPNLDMIQTAIDSLRKVAAPGDAPPQSIFTSVPNVAIQCILNKFGEYEVSIVGTDVEPDPKITSFKAVKITAEIPVMCYATYLILEENPILEHYKDSPNVSNENGVWTQEKEFEMALDSFEYSFLVGEGRSKIKIDVVFDSEDIRTFNIDAHVHFKQE